VAYLYLVRSHAFCAYPPIRVYDLNPNRRWMHRRDSTERLPYSSSRIGRASDDCGFDRLRTPTPVVYHLRP